jgi:hypothetical protein
MERGTVVLALRAPADLDLAGLAEACRRAGHRLRRVTIEARGRVDGAAVVLAGTGQRMAADLGGRAPPDGEARLRLGADRWDPPVLRVELQR